MTEPRPISSAQPSSSASTPAPDRRALQDDSIARFHQALHEPSPALRDLADAPDSERRDRNTSTSADVERRDLNALTRASAERDPSVSRLDAEPRDLHASTAAETERRDPSAMTSAAFMTVGSLHYSLPVNQATAAPTTAADAVDAARLIEQATSVLLERASRPDASRFIVSLDHAIVGGASAEFVRDGAFLRVRLIARNDAAYRSMWTHQAELQERLAASTGLVTRVEILEVYGDGRSA